MTNVRLQLRPAQCLRLWEVNKELRPDAEMQFGELKMYVEVETGSNPYRRVVRRFKRYEKGLRLKELVLWVCLTEERMHGLMRRAESLRGKALFTVLGSNVFQDVTGEKITI